MTEETLPLAMLVRLDAETGRWEPVWSTPWPMHPHAGKRFPDRAENILASTELWVTVVVDPKGPADRSGVALGRSVPC